MNVVLRWRLDCSLFNLDAGIRHIMKAMSRVFF